MARHSCLDCVRKHLAQAIALLDEARLGYPHHRWLAVGHMAEAESESLREYPALAKDIRSCRLEIMNKRLDTTVCVEELIRKACILAGDLDDVQDSTINSKLFETTYRDRPVPLPPPTEPNYE